MNKPVWDRLEALLDGPAGQPRGIDEDHIAELVRAYQRTSAHLSHARSLGDDSLVAALSGLTGRANAVIYGTRPRTLRGLARFFADTFPAAVWRLRYHIVVSAALFVLPAVGLAMWISGSPSALEAVAPDALREAYVAEDFEEYYSSAPASVFASQVTTNNIQVAALAFAAGVLLCLPTAFILVVNGASLGGAAGLFAAADQMEKFWGLILPHGLLEVTAVVVAGAAGLCLGWAIIDPGDRSRGEALVEEGRRAVAVVIGLVLAFCVAGLIEGFITGSTLPTWARVGTGVVAQVAFCCYAVIRGRAASARGLSGQIGEQRG